MDKHTKISPTLAPFLDEQSSNDQRDAILVFRDPSGMPSVSDYSSERSRKSLLADVAQKLQPLREKVAEKYQTVLRRNKIEPKESGLTPVGSGYLPVGKIPVTRSTLLDLAEMDEVVAILPNAKLEKIDPQDTVFRSPDLDERRDGMTWGLKALSIQDVWKEGITGEGVRVAVLDTGAHGSHSTLADRVDEFVVIDAQGNRHVLKDNGSFDADRHGTHVCGTIAGGVDSNHIAIGVAPKASLSVAAVLIGRTTLWTLMEGLDWAISQGARVVNLSLGIRGYEPQLSNLCEILIRDFNVIPVAAIGNDSHGSTSSPGNAPAALSVGAVDQGYRGRLSVPFFSGGGSLVVDSIGRPRSFVTKPDVVAPGVNVYSAIPPEDRYDAPYSCAYMNGTSMSAPHVSGVAALLLQGCPDATAADVIDALKSTAKYHGLNSSPDNRWGMGLIQPLEALRKLQGGKPHKS